MFQIVRFSHQISCTASLGEVLIFDRNVSCSRSRRMEYTTPDYQESTITILLPLDVLCMFIPLKFNKTERVIFALKVKTLLDVENNIIYKNSHPNLRNT